MASLASPAAGAPERRIATGTWLGTVGAILLAVASVLAARGVARSLGDVAFTDASSLIDVQRLRIAAEVKGRRARGYLLTGNRGAIAEMRQAGDEFTKRLSELRRGVSSEDVDLLEAVGREGRSYDQAIDHVVRLRESGAETSAVVAAFETAVQPAREELGRALLDLSSFHERHLAQARAEAARTVSLTLSALGVLAGAAVLSALLLGLRHARALRELRTQREAVAAHVEHLAALNGELDAFAGRASHDLRNLLSPLAMNVRLLEKAAEDPARVRAIAQRIDRAADRCVLMVDGLLAFSRSSRPEALSAAVAEPVIEDVLEQLAPISSRVGASIERRFEAPSDTEVACSQALLHVALSNLIGNALKFMEGGERRVVTVASRRAGAVLEIAITDTGPGIPAAALQHIFEPFYRVPGTTAPGTGIGLATVRRIVEAHGGTVTAESNVEGGATFRVRLPIAAAPARHPAPSA